MHSLTIVFGPAGTVWTLLFKEKEKAWDTFVEIGSGLNAPSPIVTDDFGQTLSVPREHILGLLVEDMDLSQQAQIERGVHQARSQAKAQEKALNDPVIAASIRKQQMGPAVYQPGMPNGRGIM